MKLTSLSLLLIASLLLGCGGGNSNSSSSTTPSATPGAAQGVYSGTTSTGTAFSTIVLPNDSIWVLYGTSTPSIFYVAGMMTGQGASKSGSYTANLQDFYWTGATYTASVTATYVPGASMNGSVTEGGGVGTYTFSGAPLASSNYNYSAPASLSAVSGTWRGTLLDGTSAILTISTSGTLTGSNLGCSFTGKVAPDSSGKNLFAVSLTFGGSPCVLPGQTASGIGITYLLANGVTRQLVFGGTSGSNGTVFMATR